MKFDKLEHSKLFVSNPGSRYKAMYHGEVMEDGSIKLVYDGEEDISKRLQADAIGADIPSIVARATAGDPTAFRNDAGWYGDTVGMPKTYAEILNTVNEGQEKFAKLPVEVKEKFDNSFEKWFATLGQKEWFENMGFNLRSDSGPGPIEKEGVEE